jgi:hypothetical protein
VELGDLRRECFVFENGFWPRRKLSIAASCGGFRERGGDRGRSESHHLADAHLRERRPQIHRRGGDFCEGRFRFRETLLVERNRQREAIALKARIAARASGFADLTKRLRNRA